MDSSGEAEVTDQHRRSRVAAIATESPWLLVVLFVALGFYSVAAPAPRPADAPAGEFSANRAIDHVAAIAQQPHPMGSAEIAEVRAYIVSELRSLGLEPDLHRTDAPDYFGDEDSVEIVNVIARLPGSQGQRTVALMAHYDTVPETSGANDNSAAVATLLEAARVISNGPPVAHDVVLLFTDGEEPSPRFGATAFVDERSAAENIGFV
ncbi:MAG: M20/M25/M40 family metallo-hydrolase, partial [Acidimicrobiia bacterium]|nr:M20/M25/M40 family metallo-hydrolase [Acidimicrobiia bacterium]